MHASEDLWFSFPKPNFGASARLFCFPCAGGSANIFRDWSYQISKVAELVIVNLPGRGRRRHEPPYVRIGPLVDAVASAIAPLLNKPALFFGHSMGGLITFELAHRLRNEGQMPLHLCLSSRPAPHLRSSRPWIHRLPDQEFIQQLRYLDGTPGQVLDDRQMLQLMLPVLRADFEVCETYQYCPKGPLDCDITVFGGVDDHEIPEDALVAWHTHTCADFHVHTFPGGHFYLNAMRGPVLKKLNEVINGSVELTNPTGQQSQTTMHYGQ